MEFDEDYRQGADVEPDSDTEDTDHESQLSQWLGELENYAKGLEPGDTSTVHRRQKAVVTPKMAMESFRYSFLSENQDFNFEAILGELSELETQLGTAQSQLPYYKQGQSAETGKDESRDSGNDLAQFELDALATEITQSFSYNNKHKHQIGEIEYFRTHYPGDLGGYSDAMLDIAETDSAFSESASLPSSESFTSMVTVSSAAETAGIGDGGSIITAHIWRCDEDQQAKLKAEKIKIALEKIKEAKIKKLFVRAFACDGSSKSIMVDENMSILEVVAVLADKNHIRLNADLAIVEHIPELFMERIFEEHDYLVDNIAMWTTDTKNKILFENRPQKNDLFKCPERYLLLSSSSSSSEKGASLHPKRRENLIQEFFAGNATQVPEIEGVLYLKSDGKKAWKKYFCVLRASGIFYNPKGKISKSPKDLTCLVQFEFVELYIGLHWKKKYHSPTDFCFALKHPQIQKKSSKFIRYLCAENKAALDQWIMGIRIAKFGKQLFTNYLSLEREILAWDTRDSRASISNKQDTAQAVAELNKEGNLNDSRMSMPELGCRHSIVNVKSSTLVHDSFNAGSSGNVGCIEIDKLHETKSSVPIGQTNEQIKTEKVLVKRVSFSNTHSVINDTGQEVIPAKHRESITSASTDSSEDSTSSGEGIRFGGMAHRSNKLRAKLPVTTGTTKHLSEMVQTSFEGASVGSGDGSVEDWRSSIMSPTQRDLNERRKSAPLCSVGDLHNERKIEGPAKFLSHSIPCDEMPMSPTSSDPNFLLQNRIQKGIMSPSQKGPYKSHSRGSSMSSIDSSDSGQGYVFSPTGFDFSHIGWNQFSSDQPDESCSADIRDQIQCHIPKQGPPTAQKPLGNKINRTHSGSPSGLVDRGHKRNTSKSSLESVEEMPREAHFSKIPIPVSSLPPRSLLTSPTPPSSNHYRSNSQPAGTSVMNSLAPNLSQPELYHRFDLSHMTMGPHSAPTSPQVSSPVPTSIIGCLSPRLSIRRGSGPKPLVPPGWSSSTTTPPALVPPAHHNPATVVKMHKKRTSEGSTVVNGNQVTMLQGSYPDIAICPKLQSYTALEAQDACQVKNAIQLSNKNSVPFMSELSHVDKPKSDSGHIQHLEVNRLPSQTVPKQVDTRDKVCGHSIQWELGSSNFSSQDGFQNGPIGSVSQPAPMPQQSRKALPPPPPKRSDTTRLSTSVNARANVPNQIVIENDDPIYGNWEGILDINDLPPPPPELLEGFESHCDIGKGQALGAPFGKIKLPPSLPPPKQNRDKENS